MMNGATSLMRRTRVTYTRVPATGSSMMRMRAVLQPEPVLRSVAGHVAADPIGLEGGWSLYAYPLNPVNGIN